MSRVEYSIWAKDFSSNPFRPGEERSFQLQGTSQLFETGAWAVSAHVQQLAGGGGTGKLVVVSATPIWLFFPPNTNVRRMDVVLRNAGNQSILKVNTWLASIKQPYAIEATATEQRLRIVASYDLSGRIGSVMALPKGVESGWLQPRDGECVGQFELPDVSSDLNIADTHIHLETIVNHYRVESGPAGIRLARRASDHADGRHRFAAEPAMAFAN